MSCGHRPNIAALIPGADASRTFWVIAHLDVVPPGDLSLWDSDPYELMVDGDLIRGRGVEDNQQAIASAALLAKALLAHDVTPPVNYGMLFVSDEETGSRFGLDYVAANAPGLFSRRALFLIPLRRRTGDGRGGREKQLWIMSGLRRAMTRSTPDEGRNSMWTPRT